MLFRIVIILTLVVTGSLYHADGMNDWFAHATISSDVTVAQAANEIIASLNFIAAFVLFAIWWDNRSWPRIRLVKKDNVR